MAGVCSVRVFIIVIPRYGHDRIDPPARSGAAVVLAVGGCRALRRAAERGHKRTANPQGAGATLAAQKARIGRALCGCGRPCQTHQVFPAEPATKPAKRNAMKPRCSRSVSKEVRGWGAAVEVGAAITTLVVEAAPVAMKVTVEVDAEPDAGGFIA
jgi:hypothetical protein